MKDHCASKFGRKDHAHHGELWRHRSLPLARVMGTLVQGRHGKQGRVSNIISYAINLVMLALSPVCEVVQRVQRNMEWLIWGGT